jgi:hypothetical protein
MCFLESAKLGRKIGQFFGVGSFPFSLFLVEGLSDEGDLPEDRSFFLVVSDADGCRTFEEHMLQQMCQARLAFPLIHRAGPVADVKGCGGTDWAF